MSEIRYYMVLNNEKFVGFITGYTDEEAKEKLKSINLNYKIHGNYVYKPRK